MISVIKGRAFFLQFGRSAMFLLVSLGMPQNPVPTQMQHASADFA